MNWSASIQIRALPRTSHRRQRPSASPRSPSVCLALLGLAILGTGLVAADTPSDIPAALGLRFSTVAAPGALRAQDGWYFLGQELHAYAAGSLSAARHSPLGDPLAAIVDFNTMVAKAGMKLLVVPIPGKVAVYPDRLDPAWGWERRFDAEQSAFIQELRVNGVEILDLLPDFLALRQQGIDVYCHQDSHWSPQGMQRAAEAIQRWISAQAWHQDMPKLVTTRVAQSVSAIGDLAALLPERGDPESLHVFRVESDGQALASDRQSPIVLMGDSFTLVYHGDGLLAEAAGLSDQLAALCASRIDLIGVLGGGANGSRMILARRRDNLTGKKCLVWVFSARELSESGDGWKTIPVIR